VLATESALSTTELEDLLVDARRATRALVADLTDEQMLGPRLRIVNPPLWEIGHLAWFQEKWTLRHLRGLPPSHADADALYDSAAVPHATRWDLPLPARAATLARLQETLDSVLGYLRTEPLTDAARYFHQLAVFHEDMHAEALGYTRQTHGLSLIHIDAADE
jgi:iron(II)-dependent oxidoreductase